MSFPLLMTKLHIPHPQPGLIARPRLLERINQGMQSSLTLISAPAGFGKTALVEQWVAGCRLKVSWLSLDKNDNDSTRFWGYIIAALQKIQENLGENVRTLLVTMGQSLQPFPSESLITTLLNEIMALPDEIVLILDDYHLIDNPAIQEDMIFLLEHLPSNMHIILSSRMDPPFPLARMRAHSKMIELRSDDLRLNYEETASFLNEEMSLNLSAEDIISLVDHTEGWFVGLKLAALSLEGRQDVSAFIASFTGSHRFILDYLIEEVLHQQLDDVQNFLLETSILQRFTAPLCDAVTGRKDSQRILEQLKRSNLFIISLDDERRWFRYHHLFADLLRSLLQQLSPERLPELHRRAAEWFEQNELVNEAVSYWLTSGDFFRALQLMDRVAERMLHRGEWRTLTQWADALPENVVRSSPSLYLYHTWIRYLAGQITPDETDERLTEIEAIVSEDRGSEGDKISSVIIAELNWDQKRILGKLSAARSGFVTYEKRDAEEAIACANMALQILPEEEIYWRGLAASCLAGAYEIHGDIQLARQALTKTSIINRGDSNNYTMLVQHWREARLYAIQGNLHLAATIYRKALSQAEELGMGKLPVAGYIEFVLGDLLREWNDLDDAGRHLINGIAKLNQARRPFLALDGYISLTRLRAAQKDNNGALEVLDNIGSQIVPHQRLEWLKNSLGAWRTRIELKQGNIESAIRWAEAYGLDESDDLRYVDEPEHLTLVRVLIAQARIDSGKPSALQALDWLDRLLAFAKSQGRTGSEIEILMLRSLALKELQDISGALTVLERALSLAAPGGYIRLFVDEGEDMFWLISDCRSNIEKYNLKSEREKQTQLLVYIDRLLSEFNKNTTTPPPIIKKQRSETSILVEPLSLREIEVLRLVASGLSTDQVAGELFITVGTVRNHLKSIYGKLNAHSRVQAVEFARELSLL